MKYQTILKCCLGIIMVLFFIGCNNDKKISKYINAVPTFPTVQDEISFDHTSEIKNEIKEGKSYACYTKSGETSKNLEEFITFNPNVGVLFPGNIIHGSTLKDGVLTSVNAERNGGTLTINGLTFQGEEQVDVSKSTDSLFKKNNLSFTSASFDFLNKMTINKYGKFSYSKTIDQVTPEKVTDAIAELRDKIPAGNQVSRLFFEKQEFHSAQTNFLKLGASVKWATGKVSATLDALNSESNSKYIVKVTQPYYDISFNQKINGTRQPSDYFKNVKYKAFKQLMDDYIKSSADSIDAPCYIQSITYGRMLYLVAESNESQDSLSATMDAAFSGATVSGTLNVSAGRMNILKNSKFTLFSLGGSADATVTVINGGTEHIADSLKKYMQDGANYSKNSPGWPISFVAKYIKNDDVAKIGLTYKYSVPICTPNPKQVTLIKFNFIVTDDDKDKEEGVSAYITKGDTKIVGAGPWGYAVDWRKNSGPYSFSLPVSNINEVELNNVRLWIIKSSEGGGGCGWGAGWHFVLNISVVFDDGTEKVMNSYPNCMMGNCSSGIQVFPVIH